jgi:hypothetical protein
MKRKSICHVHLYFKARLKAKVNRKVNPKVKARIKKDKRKKTLTSLTKLTWLTDKNKTETGPIKSYPQLKTNLSQLVKK